MELTFVYHPVCMTYSSVVAQNILGEMCLFDTDFASSVGDQTLFGTDFPEGCCAARRVLQVFGNSERHPFNMVIHFNCYNCICSEFPEYHVLILLVKANWIKIGSGFASGA